MKQKCKIRKKRKSIKLNFFKDHKYSKIMREKKKFLKIKFSQYLLKGEVITFLNLEKNFHMQIFFAYSVTAYNSC